MIALTGASGYIGSHLLQVLEAEGRPVRALSRSPERLDGRGVATTEVVAADLLDASSLVQAFDGAEALVYLAHGLGGDDFARDDRQAALNAAAAAEAAGVGRIVYLGGLGAGRRSRRTSRAGRRWAGSCATRASRRPSCGRRSCSAKAARPTTC